MADIHHFTRVDFHRFKAFNNFAFNIRHFNVLIGPNNAGKSTILTAFRMLAAAMRKATTRKPEFIRGPQGRVLGYSIDLSSVSVAEENIFFNYDDTEAAIIKFTLSNKNALTLYFPEQGTCYLLADANGRPITTPSAFKSQFNCPIGFVPILGPVDHHENLFEQEAARLALYNYRASRNFRNIWYHNPNEFRDFRTALIQTWPGMDIEPPKVDYTHDKPRLHMFCPEDRIPREIFWAGFGFQVWCQMLTHVILAKKVSLFLIDEPDIYLHSELQRQLLGLLRNMGPDILIATHSTEMIVEAETDDLVLVNKQRTAASRIRNASQVQAVFTALGSNLNPILTQLAKTRRALFVEGKDFQILGKFARKLGSDNIGNQREFAVISVEGFNPERVRNLKRGMEETLGSAIQSAVVLDRDYRSDAECTSIYDDCAKFCDLVIIHKRKEIENFLLVPSAIARAFARRCADHARRGGAKVSYDPDFLKMLERFATEKRDYTTAQYLDYWKRFARRSTPQIHEASLNQTALAEFGKRWNDGTSWVDMIPGKEAFSYINNQLQEHSGISLTPTAVIDAMTADEVPSEMRHLVAKLSEFAQMRPA